ncbi:hypothetical protein [Chroococcidiopsis cubana]|uniref:hypothetical protein n=1 Tax=Chroococcidiopsis cubana TaxID=171392 RepID=UPI0013152C63|nr:hypothetical protein [Chroococcidiopsis cubana]
MVVQIDFINPNFKATFRTSSSQAIERSKQYKDYGDRPCNLQVYIFEIVGILNAIALG